MVTIKAQLLTILDANPEISWKEAESRLDGLTRGNFYKVKKNYSPSNSRASESVEEVTSPALEEELEGLTLLERYTHHLNRLMFRENPTTPQLSLVERYLDKVGEFAHVNPEIEDGIEELLKERSEEELVEIALRGSLQLSSSPEEDSRESLSRSETL